MKKICQNCKYHYIEEISFDYPQSCCNRTNPHYTTEAGLSCDKFECSEEYMKTQLEAYENMRKELIKIINYTCFKDFENKEKYIKYLDNLMNILNKVGGSDE